MKIIKVIKEFLKTMLQKIFSKKKCSKTNSDNIEVPNETVSEDTYWTPCYYYDLCLHFDVCLDIGGLDLSGIIYDKEEDLVEEGKSISEEDGIISKDDVVNDNDSVREEFENRILDVFNVELEAKHVGHELKDIPDPNNDHWVRLYEPYFKQEEFFNIRNKLIDSDEVRLRHNGRHYIDWYDIRDLYDVYTFENTDDGGIVATQICSDDEKFEKLKTRRRYSFTADSFDELIKFMNDYLIRVEYIIYNFWDNVLAG